jgi:hypothetical protein
MAFDLSSSNDLQDDITAQAFAAPPETDDRKQGCSQLNVDTLLAAQLSRRQTAISPLQQTSRRNEMRASFLAADRRPRSPYLSRIFSTIQMLLCHEQ